MAESGQNTLKVCIHRFLAWRYSG